MQKRWTLPSPSDLVHEGRPETSPTKTEGDPTSSSRLEGRWGS